MEWQKHEPGILTWSWEADRQDESPLPLSRPHFGPEGASGFRDLIFSQRADTVDSTAIGRELCELRDQLGFPAEIDFLCNDAKRSVISDAGWGRELLLCSSA